MLTIDQKNYQSLSKQLSQLLPPRKAEVKHKFNVLEYPKPKIKEKHIFSGAPGRDGKDGINGKDGKNGRMGVDGRDGKDGNDGRDGKDGESVDKEAVKEMVLEALEELKDDNKKILDEAGVDGIVKKHVTDINNRLAQQIATLRGDVMRNYGGHGGSGGGTTTTAVYNEVVAGSGTTFTLAHTPVLGSEQLYAIGQRLTLTVDYTILGKVITTLSSWVAGQILADFVY